jgi:DNA-binding NarL/FixJ family response regulator
MTKQNTHEEISILIADDSTSLAESLKLAIQHAFSNAEVLLASNQSEVMNQMNEGIDIILLDIQFMTDEYDGIEIARWIKKSFTKPRILMMSQYVKAEYKDLLINTIGVNGYLDKQSSLVLVLDSIKRVLAGELVIDPLVTEIIDKKRKHKISRRETEVLDLLKNGETQQAIANQLFISPRTVEGHVLNLRTRYELRTTAELLVFYAKYKTSFREDGGGTNAPFLT